MQDRSVKPKFYEFDDVIVDVEKRRVTRAGGPVSLTPKVFELLLVFLENRGEVLDKERLMSRLWPDSFVEESNLTQNVAVLRRSLDLNAKADVRILTVPGRGYKFVGDVRQMDSAADSPPQETAAIATEVLSSGNGGSRRWLLLLAAVAIILGGAGALSYRETGRIFPLSRKHPEIKKTGQITSWSGLDIYPALSPDGTSIAYSSDKTGSFELYLRPLLPNASEIQITNDGGQNFEPAFSKDGKLIAYYSKYRGGIWVVPSTGGVPKQLTQFGSLPAWSPDGSLIAFQSDPLTDMGSNARNAMPPSTIWTVASNGGEPIQVTMAGEPPGGHGSPTWSPDGTFLLFDVGDWATSSLWTLKLADRSLKQIRTTSQSAGDGVFAPDGRSIYFIGDVGLSLQNVALSASGEAEGDPVKLSDASGTRVRHVSISGDGKRIVYSALSTSSNIWTTPIGKTAEPAESSQLTKNSYTRTVLPGFSPDGSKIIYQSFTTGMEANLWMMNADGSDQRRMTSRAALNPWWIRDGSKIMFISSNDNRSTSMWSITPDGSMEKKLFDFPEPEIFTARPSPDGKWVIYNSKKGDGILNLWMISSEGGEPRQVTFDKEFGGFGCWSPDGRWIGYQIKRGEYTYAAIIPSQGGEPVQLNSDPGQTWIHDWSPDGEKLLFAGQRNGIWNIYAISRTTRQTEKLTNFTKLNSYVRYPAWSPRNDEIVYEYAETTGNVWMADLE